MKKIIISLLFLLTIEARSEVLSYAIMGDAGVWNHSTYLLQQSIKAGKIKHLILPGDNLYAGKYEDVWGHWKGFRANIVAIGNHASSYAEEIKYFHLPGEYYKFKPHSDVVFFILNSDNESNVRQQAAWLKKSLEYAKEKTIFVVFHHPPYTISRRHKWREKEAFHRLIRPILFNNRKKLDAVIVGHDHQASLIMLNDLPLIVSGAAFEFFPAEQLDYVSSDRVRVRTAWRYKGGPHWVRLDINTTTNEVWLNYVRAKPMKVVCSVNLSKKKIRMKNNCRM